MRDALETLDTWPIEEKAHAGDLIADVLEAILQLAAPSRQEQGNRCYEAYRDPSGPRVFRLFEIYEDEAAFQAHLASDHFRESGVGKALPLLEDRAIAFYETLE